jgi:hypothetical protein
LPSELSGQFARPAQDTEDFLRKENYKNTGLPENGLSFLRKSKLPTAEALYDYVKTKKPIGYSECLLGDLEAKHLKYLVTGPNEEHLSVRCSDCDMADGKGNVCKPEKAKEVGACPFFGIDNYDLSKLLKVIEKPTPRQSEAPKETKKPAK